MWLIEDDDDALYGVVSDEEALSTQGVPLVSMDLAYTLCEN